MEKVIVIGREKVPSHIDFPQSKLPQIYELLELYRENKTMIIFKSRTEVNDYLNSL